MRVGVFSVIDWAFLDQRPQVIAKKLSEWGHQVVYIEPFFKLRQWSDQFDHPWAEYEADCWTKRPVYPGVEAVPFLTLPAHRLISGLLKKNEEYRERNKERVRALELDLAVVVDPAWGEILDELGIPFIYDHVDDTHQMEAVVKDSWFHAQSYCEKNAITTLYIQPNIARRHHGIYIPNGIEPAQLEMRTAPEPAFDCGCLSAIADWFDIDSILESSKKLLIIGPMDAAVRVKYENYRNSGKTNVNWIPRVSRTVGAHWLKRCRSAMVPFRDDHGIVDYVMPLKLVEYLYLGLPSISYLNKGIEEEFGEVVQFYSSLNWRGLPNLDRAIDLAISSAPSPEKLRSIALLFTWEKVFAPLKELIAELDGVPKTRASLEAKANEYVRRADATPLSKRGV